MELESPHGRIRLKVNITDDVLPGVMDVSHGWAEANVNEIVPRRFDPISGFPADLCSALDSRCHLLEANGRGFYNLS